MSEPSEAVIDWNYAGESDMLCGTDATHLERALGHVSAIFFALFIAYIDRIQEQSIARGWRLIVLLLLAYDIAGGAVANMLNSCKRFYHSPLQDDEGTSEWMAKNVRVFTALHIQPIIAAVLLRGNVGISILWYALLQVAVWAVVSVPLYVKRPVATAIVLFALLLNEYFLPLGRGLEWFIPILFIKIVLAHAVREEPYRPSLEQPV